MQYGLRKGLEDIAYELKSIKNTLAIIWHSRYQNDETDQVSPDFFADEYLSTEDCAKRLNVSDQTIRNWIALGKKNSSKGWVYGVHYVNLDPEGRSVRYIRIPWNRLIQSFAANTKNFKETGFEVKEKMYQNKREKKDSHVPNPDNPAFFLADEEDETMEE
ncbi:MAG: hypothetical protein JRF02_03880 [Deltaproteobacteria bacterium]|jgi:hypothetical protein|nr:hypothetical protein [Deltaproteobacteria bacterium]